MPKYPNVSNEYPKNKGGKCLVCKQEGADTKVVVQYSMFRGDDEVYIVHRNCIKGKPRQLILDILQKEK